MSVSSEAIADQLPSADVVRNRRLVEAAGKGDVETMTTLLAENAEIDFVEHGVSPLNAAIKEGHTNAVEFLLSKKASIEAFGNISPISMAVLRGDIKIARLIMEHKPDLAYRDGRGMTALEYAAIVAKPEMLQLLLERGADVKTLNDCGQSLMFSALTTGSLAMRDNPEYIKNVKEMIVLLKQYGLSLNDWHYYVVPDAPASASDAIPFNGYTPLMIACELAIHDLIVFLVEHGAKINQEAQYKNTAFLIASKTAELPTIRYLVDQGAELNHRDDKERYAFRSAYSRGNPAIMRYLISKGAIVVMHPADVARMSTVRQQVTTATAITPQIKVVREVFLILDSIDKLFYLAEKGVQKIKEPLANLFNNGAGFLQRTGDGQLNTPLHLVCEGGHINALRAFVAVLAQASDTKQFMEIEKGKEVQIAVFCAQNSNRETPLDVAARRKNPIVTGILVDAIQLLIDPMVIATKQLHPKFDGLPCDVIQHLYNFSLASPKGFFATQLEGRELVDEMFQRASAHSSFTEGVKYFNGNGVAVDLKRAFVYFYRAAKEGNKHALYNLAICYRQGKGATKSIRLALVCSNRAANLGLAQAAHYSWQIYRGGVDGVKDVDLNPEKYMAYLSKAAESGIPEAMFDLALELQIKSNGDTKMQNEALKLEKQAAAKNLPIAHFKLGERFENGIDVEFDLRQACIYYQFAVKNGIVEAGPRLAFCQSKQKMQELVALSKKPVQCDLSLSASADTASGVPDELPGFNLVAFQRSVAPAQVALSETVVSVERQVTASQVASQGAGTSTTAVQGTGTSATVQDKTKLKPEHKAA